MRVLACTCPGITISSSRVPKPVREGPVTGGPPLSTQSMSSVRRVASMVTRQVASTLPPNTDSAPYFTALVVSSWIAMASETASRAGISTGGPLSEMRPSLPSSKASSSLRKMTAKSTASPSSASSRCVRASEPMRPISAVWKSWMQLAHQQALPVFGALALGDVDQHVHRTGELAGFIEQRRRIGNEGHARAVRPLASRFHAAHRSLLLEADRHRALVVAQRRAVGPIELPRAAPLAGAQHRAVAPQFRGGFVVVGDAPGGVGGVDGGGQGIEQPVEALLALARIRLAAQRLDDRDDVLAIGARAGQSTLDPFGRLIHGYAPLDALGPM